MRALVLVAVLAACKGKDKPAPQAGDETPGPMAVRIDWARCEQAITTAASAPLAARPQLVLDGCQVCGGDWKPLLAWNVEGASGGPKREQVEQMMVACDAFCTGDSKLKFMAGVDKARGGSVNTPWRQLATACGDTVNGSADARFMSAPFFALDRIARAASSKGGAIADKLAALELPLPAITISGSGVALPDAAAATPNVGALHVTVLGDAIHVGTLPRAKLGASGVLAKLGNGDYPGDAVPLDKLGDALRALTGGDTTHTITILAPHAMPAVKLVPIIAAASAVAPVYLGAHAHESPAGWQLPGAIPVALQAGTDLVITDEMTVQNLARELAAVAARKQQHIGVTKQ
jgi:hypothetical protein